MNQTCMKLEEPLFLDEPASPARRGAPVDETSDPLLAFAEEKQRPHPQPVMPLASRDPVYRPGATLFVEAAAHPRTAVRVPLLIALIVVGTIIGFATMTTMLN